MNIVLFGFKSSGKGWVGKSLAKILKQDFIDTDDILEDIYFEKTGEKLDYRKIAKKHGLDFFRQLEKDAVKKISGLDNKVIATGGGTALFEENVAKFKKNGKMVLLRVDKEKLFNRIMSEGIPSFFDSKNPENSFERLFKERMEKFEEIKDIAVECTDKTAEQISEEIIKQLGKD